MPRRLEGSSTQFTFRANLAETRHGWLRLTPAYSVHLVHQLLRKYPGAAGPVLDPFSGTGTTLLSCAEAGIDCVGVDINPFLVWLSRAKVRRYSQSTRQRAWRLIERMARAAESPRPHPWVPALYRIERWWSPKTQRALGSAFESLTRACATQPEAVVDLAKLTFCRVLIQSARVSFRHQSMSFRGATGRDHDVATSLRTAGGCILRAARSPLGPGKRRARLGDARNLTFASEANRFAMVITSPPYCNRMSYVRELRPYMYWLGHLVTAQDAGALDWRAIGGTWGIATSRLNDWSPQACLAEELTQRYVRKIGNRSEVLSRYVQKYFCDLEQHTRTLFGAVKSGGSVHYIVGNSKFFDVVLPSERLLARLLMESGFEAPEVQRLRKRTSKVELFEYVVSSHRP